MENDTAQPPGSSIALHGSAWLLLVSCWWPTQFSLAAELPSLDVMAGQALFEKTWVSAPASTAASDGLGPFFNARSCAACHPAGGRGDSANSLSFVVDDPVYGRFLQTHAVQGLRAEGQVNVDFATDIVRLADGTEIVMHIPRHETYDLQYGPLSELPGARIAPSLSGLGLLEQIPEHYLEALADPDDHDGNGVSGRVNKVRHPDTEALVTGRFGWKAETGSLQVQIAKALSLDMGLGTSLFPSAYGDCTASQRECLRQTSGNSPAASDPEASDTIMDLLLTYVRNLAPEQSVQTIAVARMSNHGDDSMTRSMEVVPVEQGSFENRQAADGFAIFERVGCSDCHIPSVPVGTGLISPYTDLLLHDLGPGLAAGATTATVPSEWRTAPLWGLSSAHSYLHDGRATTLAEAIMWHAGEASSALSAYSNLPAAERDVLHTWLHSL